MTRFPNSPVFKFHLDPLIKDCYSTPMKVRSKMNLFNRSVQTKHNLDQAAQEYIALQGVKKELEIETQNLRLELENERTRAKMVQERIAHQNKLDKEEAEAKFKRLQDNFAEDKKKFEDNLLRAYENKTNDTVATLKLDYEQRAAKVALDAQVACQSMAVDYNNQLGQLKMNHVVEISKLKCDLSAEFYSRMQTELAALNKEGNANTKFVNELALAMIEKAPMVNSFEHRTYTGGHKNESLPRLESKK